MATSPGASLLWCATSQFWWIVFLVVVEWRAREQEHALASLPQNITLRWAVYAVLTLAILLHIDTQTAHEFIYFQF